LTTGQGGEVLEHGLAAIAKAWRLDGRHLEPAVQLVQGRDATGKPIVVERFGPMRIVTVRR